MSAPPLGQLDGDMKLDSDGPPRLRGAPLALFVGYLLVGLYLCDDSADTS